MGATGNVSRKAPIRHIAKPVAPTAAKPLTSSAKNRPAKTREIRMVAEERITPKRTVNLGEWYRLRLGEEKGIRNANVVSTNAASPKYQSLCSVQTPRLRA